MIPPQPKLNMNRPPMIPPPPKLNMTYQSSSASVQFPKPVPSTSQSQPQNQSFDDLTLLEHFRRCQHKYRRPGSVGDDLMTTWRMVGHNEATLRMLCRQKQPDTQEELKILLMRELNGIASAPKSHCLTEVIVETAEYFIPS